MVFKKLFFVLFIVATSLITFSIINLFSSKKTDPYIDEVKKMEIARAYFSTLNFQGVVSDFDQSHSTITLSIVDMNAQDTTINKYLKIEKGKLLVRTSERKVMNDDYEKIQVGDSIIKEKGKNFIQVKGKGDFKLLSPL